MLNLRAFLLLGLAGVLFPQRADACACCDGVHDERPLGWSAAGELLLSVHDDRACAVRDYLAVRAAGSEAPVRCRDLRGDPTKDVACDAVLDGEEQPELAVKTAKAAGLGEVFSTPARPDAKSFRVHRRAPNNNDDTGICEIDIPGKCTVFEAQRREGKAWKTVWTTVRLVQKGCPSERNCHAVPRFEVFPAPSGKAAVIRAFDFDQDDMNYVAQIVWVTLAP